MHRSVVIALGIATLAACGGDDAAPDGLPTTGPSGSGFTIQAMPPRPEDIDYSPGYERVSDTLKIGHGVRIRSQNDQLVDLRLQGQRRSVFLSLIGDPPIARFTFGSESTDFSREALQSSDQRDSFWDEPGEIGSLFYGNRVDDNLATFSAEISRVYSEDGFDISEYGIIGSLTGLNDIPASGRQLSNVYLVIGGFIHANQRVRHDYLAGTFEATFLIDNPFTDGFDQIEVTFEGRQLDDENVLVGELTAQDGLFSAQLVGSYFGPYAIESAWVGRLVRSDGTVSFMQLRTRRRP